MFSHGKQTIPTAERGFSLLEMLCVLLLLGVLGGLGLAGVSRAVAGYTLAQQHSHMVEQTALAVLRLRQELHSLHTIVELSPSKLVFQTQKNTTRTIVFQNEGLYLQEAPLLEPVLSGSIQCKAEGTPWEVTSDTQPALLTLTWETAVGKELIPSTLVFFIQGNNNAGDSSTNETL